MLGILLAAGLSRRFGGTDKLLHTLPNNSPIALAAAAHLIQAIPDSIAVVRLGNKVLADALQQVGLQVIYCDENSQDMAESLTTAIRYSANLSLANQAATNLAAANDGFVIALADMPYILPETISAVAEQLKAGADILIPTFQGQRGHPVGFAAKYRDELLAVTGDEGARSVIRRYADKVMLLETHDAGILADIDTLSDIKSGLI